MASKKQTKDTSQEQKALISEAIGYIYNERLSNIIIGLTGRTGSGCTTVANEILSRQTFDSLRLDPPKHQDLSSDDRKYRIIYDWLQNHWSPFDIIKISNLIVELCLEQDASQFLSSIKKHVTGAPLREISELSNALSLQIQQHSPLLGSLANQENKITIEAYEFYFKSLPHSIETIRQKIIESNRKAYTPMFQTFGDNLRISGSPFDNTPRPSSLYTIPKRIQQLIYLGRIRNAITGKNENYFAIDAIRHPFEIHFLRERFHNFLTIAINCDSEDRHKRIATTLRLGPDELEDLDRKEYPEGADELNNYFDFISQNLQACISNADIYISNPNLQGPLESNSNFQDLKQKVCKYIALVQHPGLVTPTAPERCMQIAFSSAQNSGCISRQVGAVITDSDFTIKAVGWNDVPKGQTSCLLRYSCDLYNGNRDSVSFSEYERTDQKFKKEGLAKFKSIPLTMPHINGRHLTYCFKSAYNKMKSGDNQVHTRALHAEENAFLQISKLGGTGLKGGFLFTTASPCVLCAKKAYQVGISKIFYVDPYPDITFSHVFGTGTGIPSVELFSGVVGSAYHALYEPIMPFKDEISALVASTQPPLPLSE